MAQANSFIGVFNYDNANEDTIVNALKIFRDNFARNTINFHEKLTKKMLEKYKTFYKANDVKKQINQTDDDELKKQYVIVEEYFTNILDPLRIFLNYLQMKKDLNYTILLYLDALKNLDIDKYFDEELFGPGLTSIMKLDNVDNNEQINNVIDNLKKIKTGSDVDKTIDTIKQIDNPGKIGNKIVNFLYTVKKDPKDIKALSATKTIIVVGILAISELAIIVIMIIFITMAILVYLLLIIGVIICVIWIVIGVIIYRKKIYQKNFKNLFFSAILGPLTLIFIR